MKVIYHVSVPEEEQTRRLRDWPRGNEFNPNDRVGRALLEALTQDLPHRLEAILETKIEVRILSAGYGSWEIAFMIIAAVSGYHDLVESLELMQNQITDVLNGTLRREGLYLPVGVSRGFAVGDKRRWRALPGAAVITNVLQIVTIILLIFMLSSPKGSRGEDRPPAGPTIPASLSILCSPAPVGNPTPLVDARARSKKGH